MHAIKGNTSADRHRLLTRLAIARLRTDRLFDMIRPEALYARPVAERHRLIFYLGHLEAFDWNLFRARLPGLKAFAPEFDRLFAFGIDPVGGGLPTDVSADWPAEATIRRYNRRVRASVDGALKAQTTLLHSKKRDLSPDETPELLLNVAIEHRLMHAETLAYLLNRLPPEDKRHPERTPARGCGWIDDGVVREGSDIQLKASEGLASKTARNMPSQNSSQASATSRAPVAISHRSSSDLAVFLTASMSHSPCTSSSATCSSKKARSRRSKCSYC